MSALFDAAAEQYDATFSNTSIGKAQRRQVWRYLENKLQSTNKILELTAGTGIDAVWFSNKVASVHVTDASKEMLSFATSRGNYSNLTYQVLNAIAVDEVNDKFDVVFSNFGGLNCLSPDEWKHFSSKLKTVLLPKGEVIFVLISSGCWWENFYFTLKGKFKEANRRKNGYAEAKVNGEVVPTWYYSPKEIAQLLGTEFTVINHLPIGFFIPPSYLYPAFKKIPWIVDLFYHLDRLLLANSPLSNKADHFLIHLKKSS